MAKKKSDTRVFSPERFGRKLREERRLAGYKNTKEFSEAITKLTWSFIDFDTLMKYERGEREPDVSKLVAITFTLYGADWKDGLAELLSFAQPKETAPYILAETIRGDIKEIEKLKLATQAKEARVWSEQLGVSLADGFELASLNLKGIFREDKDPNYLSEKDIETICNSEVFRRVFLGEEE